MKYLKFSLLLIVIVIVIFAIPRLFPQLFYKNQIQYKNLTVYSNYTIDNQIYKILDSAIILINDNVSIRNTDSYKVFLCNSYFLFWFHTFLGKLPVGASDYITNNIYVANADLVRNNANSSLEKKQYHGRSIQSVIAHEQTHIMIRNNVGILAYSDLMKKANWKVEGYCEWIAFNNKPIDYKKIDTILTTSTYQKNMVDRYQIYRLVVNYLITNKNYSLDNIIESKDDFETLVEELKKNGLSQSKILQ
jgi:hypothetical protein